MSNDTEAVRINPALTESKNKVCDSLELVATREELIECAVQRQQCLPDLRQWGTHQQEFVQPGKAQQLH